MIASPDAGPVRAFLFYAQPAWPTLFRQLLRPLIEDLQQQNHIAGYTLFLHTTRGDHIQMTLHPSQPEGPSDAMLKKNLQKHIHPFLSQYPSPVTASPSPSSGGYFFMDFPANTLYFDLPDHNPQLSETQPTAIDSRPLTNEISQILLTALAGENADDADLVTIALYLELALLKTMQPYLSKNTNPAPTPADSLIIATALPDYPEILPELKRQVWTAAADEHDLSYWWSNWEKCCADTFSMSFEPNAPESIGTHEGISAAEFTDLVSAGLFRQFNIPVLLGTALHHELKNHLRP